jgi:3-deoxy-D-manno-octulosonic-acid transferase
MARDLGLREGETIFIAGSTRPGEEEILLTIFRDLRKTIPHLIFLLAPRHLNRLEEVERILRKEQIRWIRRTSLPIRPSPLPQRSAEMPEVILLDTLGELTRLYSLGTLVFIGGSLVPLGGQNPVEPLLFKKCVLFGPHMSNFAEIARLLTEAKGAIQVRDKEDLSSQIRRLLQDEAARKEVGEKGYELLQKHGGATERIFEEIRPFLSQAGNGNLTEQIPSLI